MSWPWAKRHPMPEPAEFIRQNTTALNPDIESGILSPAQGSCPRLPSEFVLPGAGTESFNRNREVSAACQNMRLQSSRDFLTLTMNFTRP